MIIKSILASITIIICFALNCEGQNYWLFDEPDEFIELKNKVMNGEIPSLYKTKIETIFSQADEALHSQIPSVTYKKLLPISNNKNDYYTLAPYFWPDTTKIDGLPWLRRDGQVNPITRVEDNVQKNNLFKYINALSLAYYFSESKKYAVRANEIINAWFIDEKLKMNPHLNYGQAIPGVISGRPYGIIEWSGFSMVLKSIQMLDKYGVIDQEVKKGLDIWIDQFSNWLTTSDIGIQEDNTLNNHSTWYEVTLTSMYLYRNDVTNAKNRLMKVKLNRIPTQISKDGSMPFELDRTRSLTYTHMNTRAFLNLCYIGKKFNIDLYNHKGKNFGSVKDAVKNLEAIASGKKWTYPQITDFDTNDLIPTLGYAFEISRDKKLKKSLKNKKYTKNIIDHHFNINH